MQSSELSTAGAGAIAKASLGIPPQSASCKVCNGTSRIFDVVDFNKCVSDAPYIYGLSGIPIYFYRCVECKHLFTRSFDYWTPQDLSREIYNDEYVKVDPDYLGLRPRRFAEKLGSYLSDAVRAGCKVLDYGSGSGLLAEFVSSDYQIDAFDSFDPYAGNEKSRRLTGKYQLITATEVFEHWVEPTDELSKLRRILTNDGVLYVTTELQPADIEARGCRGWRYAAPRNGHINLYSNDSLRRLGADAGFTVQSNGSEHIFLPRTSESVARRPELMRFVRGVLWRSVHISSDALTSVRSIEFDDGWWGVERTGGNVSEFFRWTAREQAQVRILGAAGAGRCQLALKIYMEIELGYRQRSTFKINGKPVAVMFDDSGGPSTVSLGTIFDHEFEVALSIEQPPLMSPNQKSGAADHRRLGLAIGLEISRLPVDLG